MSKSLRGYMAGLIDPNCPESYRWRKEAQKLWGQNFHLIDPISKELKQETGIAFWTKGMYADAVNSPTIVLKDWYQVERADFLIVNFNTWTSERPLTGTIFELAWAWLLKKPVVGFGTDISTNYRNHPFVQQAVMAWFKDCDDALDYIFTHFVK